MKNERRKQIRQFIDANGEITLIDLQDMFPDCSTMTLRRDLVALEEEGDVKRTRGGAIALKRVADSEGVFYQRSVQNQKEKHEISRACLAYLNPSDSLYLDAGSTMMSLAHILPDGFRSVITPGINLGLELVKKPGTSVTLLGGQLDAHTLGTEGQLAEILADTLNIGTAVMSTSGFDLHNGFSNVSHAQNILKRSIIAKADRVIMLMDGSKYDRKMPLTFATLADIDVLISNHEPNDEFLSSCESNSVEYVYTRSAVKHALS